MFDSNSFSGCGWMVAAASIACGVIGYLLISGLVWAAHHLHFIVR